MTHKWYATGTKATDDEIIQQVMREYRVDERRARFIIDIENGRIDGDIVMVN